MIKKYFLTAVVCILAITSSTAQWNLNFTGVQGYYRIFAVHFLNNTTGFVGGGTQLVGSSARISKTTNGGSTWTTVLNTSDASDIADIYFVNSTLGFAVGTNGFIARTVDGGTTWTSQNVSDASGIQGNLYSVHFADENTGYAAGVAGGDWAIKTTDGGQTWVNLSMPTATSQHIKSIFFTSATTGYAVGGEQFGGGYGKLYSTNDGGTSWSTISTGLDSSFFEAVHFTDANTGFIGGWDGVILKTTNGGQTWSPQNNQDPEPSSVKDFSFINPNLGFACTLGGAILRTTNGGTTWTRDFYISAALSLYSISVPSSTFGIATGLGNTYVKMSGLTSSEDLFTENNSFSIFPNPTTGSITLQNLSGNLAEGNIHIVDMQGKVVFAKKFDSKTDQNYELTNLSSGMYIVHIQTDEYSLTKKLIVTKN